MATSTTTQQPSPTPETNGIAISTHSESNENTETRRSKAFRRTESQKSDGGQEVCFICASAVVHFSIAPCSHRTCHICSLRLRALYKTKACAHCRAVSDFVILTDDVTERYEDIDNSEFYQVDSSLGIKYHTKDVYDESLVLLRYNCPDSTCDVACLGWPDLHRHVRSAHQKMMCDLCTRNKKVFTHEHELFTKQQLQKHERFGDDHPGAVDQSGFKGHPECGFCRRRFYSDDELYVHCRERHERCHICESRANGRQQPYYMNYDALEEHFRKDHYLCADKECLEKKFVVFGSEMDLKAHQLEAHPNDLSKDARRDARRVDISGFAYGNPQPDSHSRRGGGRNRGRGRDPNAEAPVAVGSQPRRRDEVAFQRQLAIQSAQSITPRTFAGQLTTVGEQNRPTTPQSSAATPRSGQPTSSAGNAGSAATPPRNAKPDAQQNTAQTPQEQARTLRHNAVTERAKNMLQNDGQKLENFRAKVSAYRTSELTASKLITYFFSLFDTSSVELGKLINELAELFEAPSKRDGLLKAWADWKAINEDYPTLPGSNSDPRNGISNHQDHGGSRVLKLKNSTAQSSRSSISRRAGWGGSSSSSGGSGGGAVANNASSFPTLPPSSSASSAASTTPSLNITNRAATTARQPYWPGAASARLPIRSASPSVAANTRAISVNAQSPRDARSTSASTSTSTTTTTTTTLSNDERAFPALPAAAKPLNSAFVPGLGNRVLRRDAKTDHAAGNAWAAGGKGLADWVGDDEGAVGVDGGGGSEVKGGKKGKNRKQMLYHFG